MKKKTITKHLLVLNVVGLNQSQLGDHTPNLSSLAQAGCSCHIQPQLPAVTTSVQATYLTGSMPNEHGIVANGWYMRDLAEVRFWHQSNHLLQGDQIWTDLKQLDPQVTLANIFWWYNMYCPADITVTVRPMYPADGRKIPDIYTHPAELRTLLNEKLGQFPLFNFWGPFSNIKSSEWISGAAQSILVEHKPNLTTVYLPHLDYALQKKGPNHPDIATELQRIDSVCGDLIRTAGKEQMQVVILSEYGIHEVDNPIHLNRLFRRKGWLEIREELGLELLDAGISSDQGDSDNNRWQGALRAEVMRSEIEMKSILVEKEIRLGDVLNFKAGDVIPITLPEEVLLRAESVPVFTGKVGLSSGNYAIKIDEKIIRNKK